MSTHARGLGRVHQWLLVVTGLSLVTVGLPGPANAASQYVTINGAGSTWSYNAIASWQLKVSQLGMTVNYAATGSSDGRNQFRSGTVDWAVSDIPYGVKDGDNADPPPTNSHPFAYMPVTAGATAFMYNLKIGTTRVTNLRLSGTNIAKIFTGGITMWNDPAIAVDNPALALPPTRIIPVVRSDSSGPTLQFTQWLSATQGEPWREYCTAAQRDPCTPTSVYPVAPGRGTVAMAGDLGVAGYVSASHVGAIGYVSYSYALQTGFPVAKMLNAAGYYTKPTAGHVGVSLLQTKINMNQDDPNGYLTQDLSQVYTDTDPRTYPLSGYSYMILPTTLTPPMTANKGYTLAEFGKYALCEGQSQVDALGYSALPINLVQDGFDQLKKIPGADVGSISIASCHNPTFSTDGTNTLAEQDPNPPACDRIGPIQCSIGTASIGSETLNVTVPAGPGGDDDLTLAVGADPVSLGQVPGSLEFTGTLGPVTVTDERGQLAGWYVTGSTSDFIGGEHTLDGKWLGWTPSVVSQDPAHDVVRGPAVPAGGPGLRSAPATLGSAAPGTGAGTSVLGGDLDLQAPAETPAGAYTATLTVTLLSK